MCVQERRGEGAGVNPSLLEKTDSCTSGYGQPADTHPQHVQISNGKHVVKLGSGDEHCRRAAGGRERGGWRGPSLNSQPTPNPLRPQATQYPLASWARQWSRVLRHRGSSPSTSGAFLIIRNTREKVSTTAGRGGGVTQQSRHKRPTRTPLPIRSHLPHPPQAQRGTPDALTLRYLPLGEGRFDAVRVLSAQGAGGIHGCGTRGPQTAWAPCAPCQVCADGWGDHF